MITVVEKVRFYETDMMGIAHHSNHIRWFECGRCEYFAAAGLDLFDLLDQGITYPIKSVSCEYISPINYADIIDIETRLSSSAGHRWFFPTVSSVTMITACWRQERRRTYLSTKPAEK